MSRMNTVLRTETMRCKVVAQSEKGGSVRRSSWFAPVGVFLLYWRAAPYHPPSCAHECAEARIVADLAS